MKDSANVGDTPEQEAQRTLEQRALRNVRVLVDSLEAHEHAERRTGILLAAVLGAIFLVVAIWIALALVERRSEPKEPVVRPAPAKRVPSSP
jgi:heme/copper-type cytochrome/quinol oxidase subunit 2